MSPPDVWEYSLKTTLIFMDCLSALGKLHLIVKLD